MRKSLILTAFAALCLLQTPGIGAEPSAAVKAAIADTHRLKGDTDRDAARKPEVLLGFSGIKAGDTVAELVPAGGYMTRLLSAAVGPKGQIYALNIATFNQRIKDQVAPVTKDAAYSNVAVLDEDFSQLKLPQRVDAVWTSQNYHDFKNPGMFFVDTAAMNKAIFDALKPGGLYLIVDHAAAAGSGARDTGSLHRIDPELVKREVEAAGFRFVGESKALANPEDAHTGRVPGQGGIGDKSDKFYFKFRKPG
jgi:predicted methyltransferase